MLRKLLLLFGDISIIVLSTYLSIKIAFSYTTPQQNIDLYYMMLPFNIITSGIMFNVNGLFSIAKKKYSELLLSIVVAIFNIFIIMMAFSFFVREFSYSRSVLVISSLLQVVMLAIWKYAFWRIETFLTEPRSALIVGNEKECLRMLNKIKSQPHIPYEVKYVCTDIDSSSWKYVIGTIDLVIVCADLDLKSKAEIVHFCQLSEKQVLLAPDVYELFCSGLKLDKIDDIPVFRPQYLKPTLEQRSLKRILDIVVASVAIGLTWPLMLITAIAIKFDSKGPILYSQIRTGRIEKEFKVFKFRSMKVDAEKSTGPVMAKECDNRITRLGNFIRATRIDELPQLFNVLLGDMSIVGPRPERPFFVEKFKKEIPEYIYRHNVKPGITGLAQVYGKYNTTPNDKLIYDLMYIQSCNFLTDIYIMMLTIKILVTKSSTEGIKDFAEENLSEYEINKEQC